jgi:alcohol dehydrogenase class IV
MTPASFTPPATVTLRQPPRLGFGPGCALDCAAELTARGAKRVLVVLSASARKAAAPVLDALRAQSFDLILREGVPPEPTVSDLEKLQSSLAASRESFDAVLGIGGGSVLDIAKLLAALHGQPGSVSTYFGLHLLPQRRIPLICLPTTSGAGSEVSPNAILYDESAKLKKAVISQWLVPDAAFVDPQLTVTLPPATTAATGIDALSHCLEAYANRAAHPTVDLYALEGIRLLATSLERAVRNGADLAARSDCALGSLYGGLCLGPVNTAAVHALSYPLGSEFRLAHGLANALLLPHVVRFNLPAAPARYAAIARALGVSAPAGTSDERVAALGVEKLFSLNAACGLPSKLSAVGVPSDAIPRMAVDALKITRLLKNNPREVTLADAEQIYRDAF